MIVFLLAEFTLIDFYNLSGPPNGNGVVQEVLGTNIPNEIVPVDGWSTQSPSLHQSLTPTVWKRCELLRCELNLTLLAPIIQKLDNNVEFQMVAREEAVVSHAAFGRAPHLLT